MASTRRHARTATVLACAGALVLPAGAAMAAPPDHAPAHGHADRGDTGSRSATAATTGDDAADVSGKGRGRDHAPGQVKKQDRGSRGTAAGSSADQDVAPAPPGRAPQPAAGRRSEPAPTTTPALRDVVASTSGGTNPPPPTTEPAPAAPQPQPATAAPAPPTAGTAGTAVPAAPPSEPAPSADAETAPSGRRVIWPDLDGPFRDLLRGVTSSIGDAVPRDLGPVRQPLAEVVPLLLALLGAFLALQRGIGRGLGQVPMVAAVAPRHGAGRHGA